MNATTRIDSMGQVVGVIGVGQDITTIKHEQRLRTNVAKDLRNLIDTANAPIFGTDSAGLVNEWNNKAAEITGFPVEEVMGKNLVEVYITSDYKQAVSKVLEDALQGVQTSNFEFP